MIRHLAAIAVVVCLCPSWLHAQSAEFTVNIASADVHKSPSTGSPVIGKVTRGSVLTVTRELGSWVRISWPAAADGIGYLHVSMGRIGHTSTVAIESNGWIDINLESIDRIHHIPDIDHRAACGGVPVANHDGVQEEQLELLSSQRQEVRCPSRTSLAWAAEWVARRSVSAPARGPRSAIALAFNSRCRVIR